MKTTSRHTKPGHTQALDLPPATPGICLNSHEGMPVSLGFAALPAALNAESGGSGRLVMEVLPPAGRGGLLPASDGRVQRVRDPRALAETINRQPLPVRIDVDHQSEPASPTYNKTSAAVGWLKDFFVNARGGISAVVEEGGRVRELLREKVYRFVSPAVYHDAHGNISKLSSVALLNNPNFLELRAPVANAALGRPLAPSFSLPRGEAGLGFVVRDGERMQLHATIAAHARARGIPYREAVLELAARD